MAISRVDKELLKYFIRLDEPQKKSLLEMIKSFLEPGAEPGERITNAEKIRNIQIPHYLLYFR